MGTNVRRKRAVAKQVAEIFVREGKILDPLEWTALKDKPLNVAAIRMHLGSWNRMLARVRTAEPELWALIGTDEGKKHTPVVKANSVNAKKEEPSLIDKIKDKVSSDPKDDPKAALTAAMKAAKKAKDSEEAEKKAAADENN